MTPELKLKTSNQSRVLKGMALSNPMGHNSSLHRLGHPRRSDAGNNAPPEQYPSDGKANQQFSLRRVQ